MTPASSTTTQVVGAVVNAMKEFGWYENQNYHVLYRFADGHVDRIPALVDELVAQRVDVLVVIGEAGIQAAQRATKTIPTVGIAADMLRTGLAANMARPGGNLTGVNILADELNVKRLEILHEAVPAAKRIGALVLPDHAFNTLPELEAAARQLDLEFVAVTVRSLGELTGGLDALQSAGVDAVNVLASAAISPARATIIDRLNRARLPAIYEAPEIAEAGGFLGYGVIDVELSALNTALVRRRDRRLLHRQGPQRADATSILKMSRGGRSAAKPLNRDEAGIAAHIAKLPDPRFVVARQPLAPTAMQPAQKTSR